MSNLVHFEFPPPRSWEQFEELCADLFETMWSDPGLVRHGRAGQSQNGVDIIAARGSIFPVGLQCKKKAHWPNKKLTFAEVKNETEDADKFRPLLKEFYILTTALGDERLESQVRQFNESRQKCNKFLVTVLSWTEIVRRVARYDDVARKHFPLGTRGDGFTPLLATWYTRDGKLEVTGEEWELSVRELGEDYQDWPSGHVVVRQRETDDLATKIGGLQGTSNNDREHKLKLRRELRLMREKEARLEKTIRKLYTHPQFKFYMLELYDNDSPTILQSLIEFDVRRDFQNAGECKIRILPPSPERLNGPFSTYSVAQREIPLDMSSGEFSSILQAERDFPNKHYGNSIVQVVSELPAAIRSRLAIPAILRRIDRIMQEDKKSPEEMELAGYFDIDSWKYTY
ncbi:MAG TPA: hypothetical protein VK165_18385 [Azonexus sp.]|nr:hypothetical protein [Azonexus sp.]